MAYLQNIEFYHVFVYKKGVFLYMRSFCFFLNMCVLSWLSTKKKFAFWWLVALAGPLGGPPIPPGVGCFFKKGTGAASVVG